MTNFREKESSTNITKYQIFAP